MNYKFKEGEVIHCKTEEEANKILKIAHEQGYRWGDKRSYLDRNDWNFYKENTCYIITNGTYCNKNYFRLHNYTIIEASDILFELPEKWCIKVTDENRHILNNWRINIVNYRSYGISDCYPYIANDGGGNKTLWGKEITFDQFKKYVLKENNMKYTIKEIIENKIAIWCTTTEQANKLWKAFGREDDWGLRGNPNGFEVYLSEKCPEWQDGYNKNYFIKYEGATKCIDFNEIIFNDMSKEIIGYKLVKPEYEAAASMIIYGNDGSSEQLKTIVKGFNVETLKRANVLDLWFEPVYGVKEQKITLSNGKVVTIKNDRIIGADCEFSLKQLEHIKESFHYAHQTVNSLKIAQQDVILSIGCWKDIKLSELEMLIEMAK
jgi:hypothetical protein